MQVLPGLHGFLFMLKLARVGLDGPIGRAEIPGDPIQLPENMTGGTG
jgi:hypothetical protein